MGFGGFWGFKIADRVAVGSGLGWRVACVCVLTVRGGWGHGVTGRAGAALQFVAGPGGGAAGSSNLLRWAKRRPGGQIWSGVWAGVDVWGCNAMRGFSLPYHRAACRVMPYSTQRGIYRQLLRKCKRWAKF